MWARRCCPPIPALLRGHHRSGSSVPICGPTWRDGRELHGGFQCVLMARGDPPGPRGAATRPRSLPPRRIPHPTPHPPKGSEMPLCSHINVLSSHAGAIAPLSAGQERLGGVLLREQRRYRRGCPWGAAHPACDARRCSLPPTVSLLLFLFVAAPAPCTDTARPASFLSCPHPAASPAAPPALGRSGPNATPQPGGWSCPVPLLGAAHKDHHHLCLMSR